MAKFYPFLLFFLILGEWAAAQTPSDSLPLADTAALLRNPAADTPVVRSKQKRAVPAPAGDTLVRHRRDSAASAPAMVYTDSLRFSSTKPATEEYPGDWMGVLGSNPYMRFLGGDLLVREERYEPRSYDGLFYLLVGMLFFFAIVKLAFSKYLGNLLTLFFRVSMRQQQIREQVIQSPFPSLLLNILFILSGGLYASFFLSYRHYARADQFWNFFGWGCLMLSLIYFIKYLFLKIAGWIFNKQRAAETHLFVVFMTNKIIGIFLLPFLVILSFSGPLVSMSCFTLSAIMISLFYVYRVIASFKTLRNEIKITALHFFLYLCAFEIAPLLLIYKVLLTKWGEG